MSASLMIYVESSIGQDTSRKDDVAGSSSAADNSMDPSKLKSLSIRLSSESRVYRSRFVFMLIGLAPFAMQSGCGGTVNVDLLGFLTGFWTSKSTLTMPPNPVCIATISGVLQEGKRNVEVLIEGAKPYVFLCNR